MSGAAGVVGAAGGNGGPIRVAVVIPRYHPVFGGAENQCRLLTRYLSRTGRVRTAFVVTKRLDASLEPRAEVDGVPVHRLEPPGIGRWSEYEFYLRALVFLLRRRREFDLVHCHATSVVGFMATVAGWLCRKPVVLKLSSNGELMTGLRNYDGAQRLDGSLMGRLRRPLARVSVRRAHVVALNEQGLAELRLAGARRPQVINNGVDVERLRPPTPDERSEARRRHGFAPDEFVFLYTGRFVAVKGIDVLLAAAERVVATAAGAAVRFCFVGSGDRQLEDVSERMRAGAAGAAPWARIIPPTDDVAPYLRLADAFVFPSRREGMPNSVLEALAAGLPCVLSDIEPHREIADHNPRARCFLFRSGDVAALAQALEGCVAAVRGQARDGAPRPPQIDDRYRIEGVAERYARLYEAAVGREPAGR